VNNPDYTLHVTHISCLGLGAYDLFHVQFDQAEYRLIYDPDPVVRKKVKRAFVALRKAIKDYRRSPDYAHLYHSDSDLATRVDGDVWQLHRAILLHFADWLSFPVPLEQFMKQADAEEMEFEARIRVENERWERLWSSFDVWHTELRAALQLFQLDETATADSIQKQYRMLANAASRKLLCKEGGSSD
jgi:hypothetical protein